MELMKTNMKIATDTSPGATQQEPTVDAEEC